MLSQLESLPPLHKKHLTVKERTLTKTGFQFRMQKPIKCGHDDSEQHHCGHLGSKEMAKFLSKDLIVKLNSLMKFSYWKSSFASFQVNLTLLIVW